MMVDFTIEIVAFFLWSGFIYQFPFIKTQTYGVLIVILFIFVGLLNPMEIIQTTRCYIIILLYYYSISHIWDYIVIEWFEHHLIYEKIDLTL